MKTGSRVIFHSKIDQMRRIQPSIAHLFICILFSGAHSSTFTLVNKCSYPVWPGLLSNAGVPQLSTTGFLLRQGESNSIAVPAGWSGRLWGRTLCKENATTGKFTCLTADCGSATVQCSGGGASIPATLAEFTLDGSNGLDFYDVSLVDGYNLPMLIAPQGPAGRNCSATGCLVDLNIPCPSELKIIAGQNNGIVACQSACGAFSDAKYCCSAQYASPTTCRPSSYSSFFKSLCPRAYSYAFDDGTSTFTCSGADYLITFCPSRFTSLKSATAQLPEAARVSSSCDRASPLLLLSVVVLGAVPPLRHLF